MRRTQVGTISRLAASVSRSASGVCILSDQSRGPWCALENIPLTRNWNFEAPTLKCATDTARAGWATSNVALVSHLKGAFPFLQHVPLDQVAVVGGCFTSVLRDQAPNDIDLHIVAPTIEESAAVARRLIAGIVKYTGDEAERAERARWLVYTGRKLMQPQPSMDSTEQQEKVRIARETALSGLFGARRGTTITLRGIPHCSCPVQIDITPRVDLVSRLWSSDVDSGAIAYYEGEMLITTRAAFAIQNWTQKCEAPFAVLSPYRLKGQYEKGFDIVLPQLNVAKIAPRSSTMQRQGFLPCLELGNGSLLVELSGPVEGNVIPVKRMLYAGEKPEQPEEIEAEADRAAESDHASGSSKRKKNLKSVSFGALSHNLRQLLHGGELCDLQRVLTGPAVEDLPNLRAITLSKRAIWDTLHGFRLAIKQDPLSPKAASLLLEYFPATPIEVALQSLLSAVGDKAESKEESDGKLEKALRAILSKQQNMLNARCDETRAWLQTAPMQDLFHDQAHELIDESLLYGGTQLSSCRLTSAAAV